MSSSLLQQTLGAIRPPTTRAALGPGIIFVAVLKPDKIPEDDDIQTTDVFWAKIHVDKTVAILLAAYSKADARPVKLIQGPALLKETQRISSLVAKDGLCILEAVFEGELSLRLPETSRRQSAAPLQDITKNAVNQYPRPQKPGSKSATPSMFISPWPSRSKSVSVDAASQDPSCLGPVTPPVDHAGGETSAEFWAWADFYFERNELSRRGNPQNSVSRINPPKSTEKQIEDEWRVQAPWQRRYYFERIRSSQFTSPQNHRAFWIYYFDNPDSKVWETDRTSKAMTNFHAQMLSNWKHLGHHKLVEYYEQISDRSTIAPSRPTGISRTSRYSTVDETIHRDTDRATSQASRTSESVVSSSGNVSESANDSNDSDDSEDSSESPRPEETATERLNISELFDDKSVEQVEAGAKRGVEILSQLKAKLEVEPSDESEHWLSLLSNLQKQMHSTKTVIGVVGATGAGKSSVINAILDEERLVPTNCMRACTAVVTEISYNYEEAPYRAEIDFINKEDWLKELKTSFHDLFDGSGKVSREYGNEESEAGIAYAKMKAVYPSMTKEMMENTTIEKLIDHPNVKNLLGGSRSFENDNSLVFYKKLQQYVDSKEKVLGKDKRTDSERHKTREMEYWPLIRVVRLYVKAPALATGAVLVDLPGVHDSNQARAAVAQGYLKQCTGLWIVAPITRAVDDKSAKTLLGNSFKRQLKMDGGYSSVTFICSKTDDISLTEAQDSLGLDEEVAPLYARSEELRKRTRDLNNRLNELKATRSDISDAADSADETLEVWEKLETDLEDGKTVYAPKEKSLKKREREDDEPKQRKRPKYAEDSDDDDFIVNDDSDAFHSDVDSAYGGASNESDLGDPLTAKVIADKIVELKATKKEGRRQKVEVEHKMKEIRAQMAEVTKEQDDIDGDLTGRCIRGRNEYSRGAIQQDFAAGIRELDQEIAEEEDAENFNPEEDLRDYDVVANSLPVYCVSSRGYQRLMGRLQRDKGLSSFRNTEETEVPALQKHCQTLTVKTRETVCKRFLNSLSQLLNSMRLWSTSDGPGANLTREQLRKEADVLETKLNELDEAIEQAVASTCSSVQSAVQEQVHERFPGSIKAGKREAVNVQAKWGAPVDRENRPEGGLYWATYKATVRRDGTYSDHHFNDDLIEPLIKQLTPGWERAFSRLLPQALSSFANDIYQLLLTFHNEVEKRALMNGSNIAPFQILRHQLPAYKETAKDASNVVKDFINTQQKDINRAFVGTISDAMLPAYVSTTAESGPGSYMRMKNAMRTHVEQVKSTMFDDSVKHVQELLKAMMKDAEDLLSSKLDEVFLAAKRDYESVVVGKSNKPQKDVRLPAKQRKIREDILQIVDSVESMMEQVLEPEPSVEADDKDEPLEDKPEVDATTGPTEKEASQFEFDCSSLASEDPSASTAQVEVEKAHSPKEEITKTDTDEPQAITDPAPLSGNIEDLSTFPPETVGEEPATAKSPEPMKVSEPGNKENKDDDVVMIEDESGVAPTVESKSPKWKSQKTVQGPGEQWWASSTSDSGSDNDGGGEADD